MKRGHTVDYQLPDYVRRFYHDLQWNQVVVLGVGPVARVEMVLALLANLLDEQGQRTAASTVREWQRNQEEGVLSVG